MDKIDRTFSFELVAHFVIFFLTQECIQSNANHPLAESMGYIKFEGM